jgi:hypothetical protein
MRSVKIVSFGMFAWAVRCGILGEDDLRMQLGKVGALLYQLVGLGYCSLEHIFNNPCVLLYITVRNFGTAAQTIDGL